MALEANQKVRIKYQNYRGEVTWRNIIPYFNGLRFGSTEWHPTEQWLMLAYDLDKQADREFALQDVIEWVVPRVSEGEKNEF